MRLLAMLLASLSCCLAPAAPGEPRVQGMGRGGPVRPPGPQWLGTTYSPTLLQAPDNGPYTITFTDPDHATLGYNVTGHTGELDLVRMPF